MIRRLVQRGPVGRGAGLTRGFTLLELTIVILVLGIIALTAVPALSIAREARAAGAAEFIERRLLDARARAVARGRPTGLHLDPGLGTLRALEIETPGGSPAPAQTPLGEVEPAASVREHFPDATFTLVGGDGVTGAQTLWFAFDGTPQSRSPGGALLLPWGQDAVVSVSGGGVVRVVRVSGAIER